ncbi:C4b-binding protein alpha chain-like isoform X4 [Chaetodon trifascialis]|uniref:C4b-binding protein alpha chain-like isoform X4 n=1 Tax=Chaetodon trifascialis TaxID=109706 RepID=UPI00399553BF
MDVTSFLLLSCVGLVMTAQVQDCSRPVGGPNMNLKDSDLLLETFPNGTKVSFACDVGFASAGGSPVITCTNGTWSPVKLKCERKNCGPAGEMENGHIDYSEGTDFGDKIVITCNSGYRFVGKQEPREILCGDKGWMSRLPVCEAVTCNPLPPIVGGTFSPDKETYSYGDVVKYSCQNDLTLSGSSSISCSDDGIFQPAPPTCIMVQCKDPEVENADWVGGSRPPFGYKAIATFKCRSGHIMKGEATQTCEMNSQWSPGLPTCEKMPDPTKATTTTKKPTDGYCENPVIKNAEQIEGSGPPYRYNDKVTYQCKSRFSMIGEPTQTCEQSGQWSPGLPKCKSDAPPKYVMPLSIALVVITLLLICCGCFYFGVPARIKKKMGKQSNPVSPTLLVVKMTG